MANATVITGPTAVELTLTLGEAEVLRQVTRLVAGSPTRTARGVTDSIDEALRLAGVSYSSFPAVGVINFKDDNS